MRHYPIGRSVLNSEATPVRARVARYQSPRLHLSPMATTELQERDRNRIDEKYKWNIDDVCPDVAGWRNEKNRIEALLPTIRTFAGRLSSSAEVLADALDTTTSLEK